MISSLSLFALVAFFAPSAVNAHGYVQSINVGGKNISGFLPFVDPYADPVPSRAVRKIPDDGPITDVTSPDLACNQGGENGAPLVATATAGSKVTFQWTSWLDDHKGPIFVYMASCNGDCKTFSTSDAKWFKVDGADFSDGTWATDKFIADGSKWTTTIPGNLKSGQYLMRNELIALHDAGAPQFYPSCLQVTVTGGGSLVPSGSELVSIPGVYKISDFPDIWQAGADEKFVEPGPKAISDSTSTSGSKDNDVAGSTASSSLTPTSTRASSTSSPSSSTSSHQSSPSHSPSSTPTSSSGTEASNTVSASSAAKTSSGKCSATRRRRNMVKRRVSHSAKRH